MPPGVLNVVPGLGSVAGAALVDHPDVDKVTFTGSPGVGRQILRAAAGNLKRVTLELGGKSANIIFPDADLEAAATRRRIGHLLQQRPGLLGGLPHPGRMPRSTTRWWSGWSRAPKRSASAIRSIPRPRWDPLVSEVQMSRVLDYVEIGEGEGATVATGGVRHGSDGYFVAPTVFGGVEHEMRISQEEIFGPVASVIRFEDEADALRMANGTAYSLAAGVWSRDMPRVHRFARGLKAGTVWVNTYGPTDVRLPWGGARDSGFGREHGDAAIENFTEPKAVWINTAA